MKTTVLKRKALVLSMAMAFIGAMTLTQCKKEPPIVTPTEDPTETPTDTVTTPEGEIVHITLRVNQSNDEKLYVDPPHVYFETGDKIHVASNGKYVGTMTYSSETRLFSANIIASYVDNEAPLQFYMLGDLTPTETLTAGETTSCTINISDQTSDQTSKMHLPVVSYAPSNENFNETTEFTAILRNQCALVKFDVTTSSEAATCITGMNNTVTVSFATPANPMTPSMTGGGVITLSPGSGEKWAILLPQEAMEEGAMGSVYSKDGVYQGTRPNIPIIQKNAYITDAIAVSVTNEVDPSSLSLPRVTTGSATNITTSTAICHGTISANSGENIGVITEYGINYSTTDNFETSTRVEGWDLNGGSFTVHLTGLNDKCTYYYRAYATNAKGTVYGDIKSFQTLEASKPIVTTSDVTNISRTSAVGGGVVTSDGGSPVIDRGICWSTSNSEPTISDFYASSGTGIGGFSVTMTGLLPATTYYVRAYATNSEGTAYDEEVKQFSTLYEVYVSANPSDGGTVRGGGTYSGGSCTVKAEPADDYLFINWTENNVVVVDNEGNPVPASYAFTLNADRNLVANFGLKRTISVSANPTEGGTVYIGTVGTTNAICPQGTNCTVTAMPDANYLFINWTENGTEVSTDAEYTFTIPAADRNLVANFGLKRTISVSANPTGGGIAYIGTDGTGTTSAICPQGTNCTVTATPAEGYVFGNWTENGTEVSTDATYTFTVDADRTLVANFVPTYTITVAVNPTESGSVIGGGIYQHGQSCTVTATPAGGYVFDNWTENGNVVSGAGASYTFTVNGNRNLVANFSSSGKGHR